MRGFGSGLALTAATAVLASGLTACEGRKSSTARYAPAPNAADKRADEQDASSPRAAKEEAQKLQSLGYVGRTAQAPAAPPVQNAAAPNSGAVQAMVASRKLIRAGQLTVEVASYVKAAEEAVRIAERSGGYVADSRSSQDERNAQQGSITLRVPAERFSPVMADLKKLGRARAESVGTQDVTKAYADLETRLRVKCETVERLREILRGRTAKLSDVLEVERELARLTEEIEQIEGERRFYDNQVALSTITLALHEPQAVVHGGFLEPIREAFRASLDALAGSIAVLIYAVAVVIPWLIVLWPLWRLIRAIRARRRAAAPPPSVAA
jgi:Domain of unknown function (DUF4349)